MQKLLLTLSVFCLFHTLLSAQVTFTANAQSNYACDDGTFCVDVDVTNFDDILGMQFALQWDTTQYDYVSHIFYLGGQTDVVDEDEGFYAFSWFGPFTGTSLPDDSTIIQLCLDIKGIAGTSDIEFREQPGQVIEVINTSGPLTIGTEVIFNDATISITDGVNPTIVCPPDTTSANAIVGDIAPVSFDDNCGVMGVTYGLGLPTGGSGNDDASGTSFANGSTLVTYTVEDNAGNTGSCDFTVTVNDTTPLDQNIIYFDPKINVDCATNTVTVDMNVINFDSVISIQYGIFWDTSVVDYVSHTNLELDPPGDPFLTPLVSEGALALLWTKTPPPPPTPDPGLSLPDSTTLYRLEFTLKSPITLPLLRFDTIGILFPQIGKSNGSEADFELLDGSLMVIDTVAPVFDMCPMDITLSASPSACGAPFSWAAPTASDNCDAMLDIVASNPTPNGFFDIGVDTIFYIATDDAGNSDTCSFTITVNDDSPPVIGCPTDLTVNNDTGLCSAVVNGLAPSAISNCDSVVTYRIVDGMGTEVQNGMGDVSGFAFPIGTNTITYTITEGTGNADSCSFIVTVIDTEAPTITCPSDMTVNNDPGLCSASVRNLAPIAASNCDSVVTFSMVDTAGVAFQNGMGDVSGFDFPVGTTMITYTITEDNGSADSCSFMITVIDTEAPVLICPADITVSADPGVCEAAVTVPAPITADVCGIMSITNDFNNTADASGTYPVGVTTVIFTVTDVNGLTNTCPMTVTVNDDEFPTLTCPVDLTVDITTGTFATVNGIDPIATDNCGLDSIKYTTSAGGSGLNTASGQPFSIGTTTVTYTVIDSSGNSLDCSFDVTVRFTVNDLLDCPGNVTDVTDAGICGKVVTGLAPILNVPATDIDSITYQVVGPNGTVTGLDDVSGFTFDVGASVVSYFAKDNANNRDTCTFTVTIIDNVDPVWTDCPGPITVNANSDCQAVVGWGIPTASDNCEIASIDSTHASGGIFTIGTTTVTYTAVDSAGNTALCSFVVNVIDREDPTFMNCPGNIVVYADSMNCEAAAGWGIPTPMDNCGIESTDSTHASGSIFGLGTTMVMYTATDSSGNVGTCAFDVTVLDTIAPVFADCAANNLSLTLLPDCRAVATWDAPTATDNCSVPTITCTHNPGDTLDEGITTVVCLAVDASGNTSRCSFTIQVGDSSPPTVMDCPNSITMNVDPGTCAAIVNWTEPTFTDSCGMVTVSSTHSPGASFAVGTTTVRYTGTDVTGLQQFCEFEVTVIDNERPTLNCSDLIVRVDGTIVSDPGGIIQAVEGDNACEGIKLSFTNPVAQDNCQGILMTTQIDTTTLSTGSTFPVGTTLLMFAAADSSGNADTCTTSIEVLPLDNFEITFSPGDTVCTATDVTMSASSVDNVIGYSWSGPDNFISTDQSPTLLGVRPIASGEYCVTITLQSGCEATSCADLLVNQSPEFVPTSNGPICGGDLMLMGNLVDTTLRDSVTWVWTYPNGDTDNSENPVIPNAGPEFSGTFTAVATLNNGCMWQRDVIVDTRQLQAPAITSDCSEAICLGDGCELIGTEYIPQPESYNWIASPSNGAGLPADTDNNAISILPTQPGVYTYSYWVETGACTSDTASLTIVVGGDLIANDDEFSTPQNTIITGMNVIDNDSIALGLGITVTIIDSTDNGTLSTTGLGVFAYEPDEDFIGDDRFAYEVCYSCNGDLICQTAIVTINVAFDGDECRITNVISPNNDGLNDQVFIDCLEAGDLPNNELIIFNQWGDEVYSAQPYDNAQGWDGTYKGKPLPDGVYYFIFKSDSNADGQKGFIQIMR